MNAVETIRRFNAGRDPKRLAMKFKNLRKSPFVFLRGTCHLFYARLPEAQMRVKAPVVWCCGDLHLENFGSFKGDNRLVYFDINDFDESALAPASWDLVRFLTSVLLAADDLKADPTEARKLCDAFVRSYAAALVAGSPRWIERDTAGGLIEELLGSLESRTRVRHLNDRTEHKRGARRKIRCDGKRALPVSDSERARVKKMIASHAQTLTLAQTRAWPDFFEVLDVAHRIAGTGSLGLERYVVLIEGKGSPNANYLLDLKEAVPSSLVPHLKATQPAWPTQAHRIVAVQQRVQAAPMAFLHSIERRKSSYVLRGLQPSEDRIELYESGVKFEKVLGVVEEMGRIVAWGQLRSAGRQGSAIADELIEFGSTRKAWHDELVSAARRCAKLVRKDWASFCAAYDAGDLR
jgi:uncharacterized protein (DUF2252 family)